MARARKQSSNFQVHFVEGFRFQFQRNMLGMLRAVSGVLSLLVVNTIAIAQKKHVGKLQRRQAEVRCWQNRVTILWTLNQSKVMRVERQKAWDVEIQ